MTAAIEARLSRLVPVSSIVPLGAGLDHVAYLVNGSLVARVGADAAREAVLLAEVQIWSTLDVPSVVLQDNDILMYRYLPGVPLHTHPVPEPERLAPVLGEFLSRLHRAPLRDLVPLEAVPPSGWLDEAITSYRIAFPILSTAQRAAVEDFLSAAPPPASPLTTFCHNDLGTEHILVSPDSHTITGVIDWSDAAMADPAYDLALLYRDLGPDFINRLVSHYDGPLDPDYVHRARFYARCAALEDIAYALRHPPAHHYAKTALTNLHRTFGNS